MKIGQEMVEVDMEEVIIGEGILEEEIILVEEEDNSYLTFFQTKYARIPNTITPAMNAGFYFQGLLKFLQ